VVEANTFANIGILSGSITNTITHAVTLFTANVNGSVRLNNLPAGTYQVQLQGLADPANGIYTQLT
jgi:hypothetical protein